VSGELFRCAWKAPTYEGIGDYPRKNHIFPLLSSNPFASVSHCTSAPLLCVHSTSLIALTAHLPRVLPHPRSAFVPVRSVLTTSPVIPSAPTHRRTRPRTPQSLCLQSPRSHPRRDLASVHSAGLCAVPVSSTVFCSLWLEILLYYIRFNSSRSAGVRAPTLCLCLPFPLFPRCPVFSCTYP